MPKHKLSKSDEAWLRKEALKLPPDFSATLNRITISGEQAALSGLKQTNQGEAIDKNATYVTRQPNVVNMNHFRRMKKAYEDRGWEGVNIYLDKYRVDADKIFPPAPQQPEPEKPKTFMQRIRSKFTN